MAAIRNANGKIFLIRRQDATIPAADGKWDFPGGGPELNETPEQTIQRECLEEIGCRIKIVRLLPWTQVNHWKKSNGYEFAANVVCYEAIVEEGVPGSNNFESSAVGWFTPEEIRQLDVLPGIIKFVELILAGNNAV